MAKASEFKRVSVIGLGYIGLPTAAVIASRGIDVIGVDVSQKVIDTINSGSIHIVEPDLDIIVHGVVNTGKLRATLEPEPADAFMIAVPTPFKETPEGGSKEPDLSYIQAAAKSIAPVLEKGNLIVLESTSPVGATEQMAAWLQEERPDLSFPQTKSDSADIKVAHCPERVLPGYVLQELVANDRVIGGMTKACSDKAIELYQTFVKGECIVTSARTAEMAKLTENSFRDVNIAFANELSMICDKLKINVWELISLANRHPRVNILKPGPGVGGHCIAVDPWFIVDSCPDEARLIKQARHTNDEKPAHVIDLVTKAADEFKKPVVSCLGLSFKPNIDDLRESPALRIVEHLVKTEIAEILVSEPNIDSLPDSLADKVNLVTPDEAVEQSNIVVGLVAHREFKSLDLTKLAQKYVIDTCGLFR
ncbi:UDP-N-acetyl-D-mannosamine dehydrogenase [Microbulbifer yueqingensis]|uniref:UDP-N-acetyl-D-mannosaminuronic acid dehydrogenase n=1 Tax=Microbulbifer yueqingensis TaxID=658219 RepID=A0A1G8VLL7_9GAMM|nr:UDP-N-acetyl-D-mannosamine dehydrogenase [Microbulbifer yueqingensis]SDJ66912.1 UDP-N-acetyl-D-mannosaminuronic acid dehydrogenase [Microbulbifer yueqingensis]